MRKILAALIFIAALSGTSWANVLYTTDNGKLGIIGVQGVLSIDAPAVQYDGIGNNAFVASFWNGDESRVIVLDRATGDTTSWDKVFIFKSSSLSEPLKGSGNFLEGIRSTQAAVSAVSGGGLFIASRENASIVQLDTDNLKYVRSYAYKTESGDSTPHMQGVLVNYRYIYGLLEAGEAKSVFFRFDGQLKEKVAGTFKVGFPQEAASMTWLSGSRIAAAVSSGVGLLGSDGFYSLVSTDQPAKSLCPDNGDGFYFTTQTEEDGAYTSTLYHYSSDETTEICSEQGKGCQLLGIGNGMLAAVLGEKILICDSSNGATLEEFDSDTLGGVPVYACVRYISGEKSDSSNGSCTLSGAGIFMLLAFAGIAVKCRK